MKEPISKDISVTNSAKRQGHSTFEENIVISQHKTVSKSFLLIMKHLKLWSGRKSVINDKELKHWLTLIHVKLINTL